MIRMSEAIPPKLTLDSPPPYPWFNHLSAKASNGLCCPLRLAVLFNRLAAEHLYHDQRNRRSEPDHKRREFGTVDSKLSF